LIRSICAIRLTATFLKEYSLTRPPWRPLLSSAQCCLRWRHAILSRGSMVHRKCIESRHD
jgi:hypothetical protein